MALENICVEEQESGSFSMVCHHCSETLNLEELEPMEESSCPECGAAFIVPHQFGDYMLQDIIYSDDIVTTFAARDLKLQREVFVKIIDKDYIDVNADFSKGLNLPLNSGILTVYSREFAEEGMVLVTEFVDGNTIQKYLDDGDHLSTENILVIAEKVAGSMAYASANGVIHGNLTPASIWINSRSEFKVGDFSLKINLCNRNSSPEKIGKAIDVRYASPSKLQHLVNDEKSDLYSYGTILYQLFTRVLPFQATYYHEAIQERQTKSVQNPRVLNKNIPEDVAEFIVSLLVQNGSYNSFSDVIAFLESRTASSKSTPGKKSVAAKAKKGLPKRKSLHQNPNAGNKRKSAAVKPNRQIEKLSKSLLITRLVAILAIGFGSILFVSRYFPHSATGKAAEQFLSATFDNMFSKPPVNGQSTPTVKE